MMESSDAATLVAAVNELKSEVAELKGIVRALLAAVESVDESTKESTTKITSAIQRWT